MSNLLTRWFVKVHDARLQCLHGDSQGLTVLAYVIGAAGIVLPLAIIMFLFGQDAADKAEADVIALGAGGSP